MKRVLMVFGVFFMVALPIFSSIASAQTVSFTGSVKSTGSPGTAIAGATIELVGNPSVSTTSDASGNFTLSGLSSGPECALKVSGTGFVPAYFGNIPTTSNFTSPRSFILFTSSQVSSWGVTAGKSAIVGRVIDGANPQTGYIGGAVITYTSALHPGNPPYTVGYQDSSGPIGGTATYPATGKFYILNVDDGDTVTVTVSAQGWTFAPITFVTHADGISEVFTFGVGGTPPSTISFTGSVKTPANPSPVAVSGALIEMVGNTSVNAVSGADGAFTVTGLPSGTNFSLKISGSGFVPSYTSVFNSASSIVSPRDYMLQTSQQISGWNLTQGKSAIAGRVVDSTNPQTGYIGGATVTYTSSLHPTNPPYTVGYQDSSGPIGGTATYPATGKFFVLNVDDGDTVTVTVTKQGWTFTPKTFVTAVDGISQGSIFGTATANPNQFPLAAGWNFVSFPKQPPDTTIGTVLSGILSDVKAVWGFDNSQKVWKLYKPGGSGNTLTTLEQGKGYWIFLSADHTLDLTTWTSGSSQVHLYEGWNLVGYSGNNSTGIIPSLTSVTGWEVAWVWIGGTWKADSALGLTLPIPPVSTFEQGRAYWIKMGTGTSGNWNQ